MKQILIVESSPMGEKSLTRQVSRRLEERLRRMHPEARVVRRDLAESPLPHLGEAAITAQRAGGAARGLSDELVEELLASDLVAISAPMWNFGIPSGLKAWIDHVVRAGKTFSYSESGPKGLAAVKKAIVITASGGVYSSGPMQSADFVEPYLRRVLGFIGIQDVQTVRAEGVAIPSLADSARAEALKAVDALTFASAAT